MAEQNTKSTSSSAPVSTLLRRIKQEYKDQPLRAAGSTMTILVPLIAAIAWGAQWIWPTLAIIGLVFAAVCCTYLTWHTLIFVVIPFRGDWKTRTNMFVHKAIYSVGCLAIAIVVSMPTNWIDPRLHIHQSRLDEAVSRLQTYLDQDASEELTNEQLVAEATQLYHRAQEGLSLGFRVSRAVTIVRYMVVIWALLLAILQAAAVADGVIRVAMAHQKYLEELTEAMADPSMRESLKEMQAVLSELRSELRSPDTE